MTAGGESEKDGRGGRGGRVCRARDEEEGDRLPDCWGENEEGRDCIRITVKLRIKLSRDWTTF